MNKNGRVVEDLAQSSLAKLKTDLHIINGITKNPGIMLAAYDGRDRGNKSYIGGQKELARVLGISYYNLDTSKASKEQVIQAIEKYNLEKVIASMFIGNPIHTELNFQDTVDRVSPVKEIDGLSSFHKKQYQNGSKENLEEIYFHPTALSVIQLLQTTIGELQSKKILLAGSKGKVGSIVIELLNILAAETIEYNVPPSYYDLPDDQKARKITQDIRDIGEEQSYDGFVSAIRGAHMFDGSLFDAFEGPIVDLTTMQDPETKIVLGGVNTNTLKANKIYIPPVRKIESLGVGTLTKDELMGNHIRALVRQLIIQGVDEKHFKEVVHKPDNSDIISTMQESY